MSGMRRLWILPLASVVVLAGCLGPSASAKDVAPATATRLPQPEMSIEATIQNQPADAQTPEVRIRVTIKNGGAAPLPIQPSDFTLLSDQGDSFTQSGPPIPAQTLSTTLDPGATGTGTLTFLAPAAALTHGCLLYRSPRSPVMTCANLRGDSARIAAHSLPLPTNLREYRLSGGQGMPWDTVMDSSGNIWFAEPGCSFAPVCAPEAPPGQIGEMNARTHTVRLFQLPAIQGNQPMFLTFDTNGHLWFTTPDNSMIGEFDPQNWKLEGQWQVIPDSGPWDLTFAKGQIWYTENFISGIGVFNPVTHTFRDYVTPSLNSHPYGLASDPTRNGRLWFTENSSSVARIGLVDIATGKIAEYPIRPTLNESLTPHLITVDAQGHPWWSEGTAHAIGTLDPAATVPGQCVVTGGDCQGIIEYHLPPTPPACVHSHVSGIDAQGGLIWFDDSLSAQIGSFDPQSLSFRLYNLAVCNTHPHDGLLADASGHVWWNEQYLNFIGELS